MTHVIICGGRHEQRTPRRVRWLDTQRRELAITKVLHGAASGIDTDAALWAQQWGIPVDAYPADWRRHGAAAGPRRNMHMLATLKSQTHGEACAVLAFPGGTGTADLCRKALRAAIPLYLYPCEGDDVSTTTPTPTGTETTTVESDDIPEHAVPTAVLDALAETKPAPAPPATLPPGQEAHLQGFLQYLQAKLHTWLMDEHHTMTTGMDATLAGVRDWAKTIFSANEHSQYQLSDALLKLLEQGVKLRHDPYNVSIQAISPQGFPTTLHIAQANADALATELGALLVRLEKGGFTPPKEQA